MTIRNEKQRHAPGKSQRHGGRLPYPLCYSPSLHPAALPHLTLPPSSPLLHIQASTNKYDRQLRLWGASGQESLGLSHAVLVSTRGSVGTELLKNLVLPGLGGFTVVDSGVYPDSSENGSMMAKAIPASNFFFPHPSEETDGKSVAEVVCSTLNELNPEVS